MLAIQNYNIQGGYLSSTTQTGFISRQNASQADNWQSCNAAVLKGLRWDEMIDVIDEQAKTNPICLNSLLDGLAILREVSLHPYDEGYDCHYALLLRGMQVVGLVCLNREGESDSIYDSEYLPLERLNTRYLMLNTMDYGASSVILASSRFGTSHNILDFDEGDYVCNVCDSLSMFGIELLDWLIIIPSENSSWRWHCDEGESFYRGINEWQFMDFGTPYAETAIA